MCDLPLEAFKSQNIKCGMCIMFDTGTLCWQGGLALFVQVMPILILVIVSALSQIMVNNPPYSLSFRP